MMAIPRWLFQDIFHTRVEGGFAPQPQAFQSFSSIVVSLSRGIIRIQLIDCALIWSHCFYPDGLASLGLDPPGKRGCPNRGQFMLCKSFHPRIPLREIEKATAEHGGLFAAKLFFCS
jgi:hypothetical protein